MMMIGLVQGEVQLRATPSVARVQKASRIPRPGHSSLRPRTTYYKVHVKLCGILTVLPATPKRQRCSLEGSPAG